MPYGYEPWTPGEMVPAADLNALADQGFPTFTNASSRDALWPAPPPGARSVLLDDPAGAWYYAGPGVGWQRQGAWPVGRFSDHGVFAQGDPANGAIGHAAVVGDSRIGRLYRLGVRCSVNLASGTIVTLSVQITAPGVSAGTYRVAARHLLAGQWCCLSGVRWLVPPTDRVGATWRVWLVSNGIVCARRDVHLFVDDHGPYPGAPLPAAGDLEADAELELEGGSDAAD